MLKESIIAACAAMLVVVSASAQYTLIDLGDLPGGEQFAIARAINNRGQVVGVSEGADGARAVAWDSSGTMRTLGTLPGTNWAGAYDINDYGVVVGRNLDESIGYYRAVMWDADGAIQDILGLPAEARAINNAGMVAGFVNGEDYQRGFAWDSLNGWRETAPDYAGPTPAYAINNAGVVVGDCVGGGYVWTDEDGVTNIPGEVPWAINDAGEVLEYAVSSCTSYVWRPNGDFEAIQGIRGRSLNNRGQIVGTDSASFLSEGLIWDAVHGVRNLNDLTPERNGLTIHIPYDINDNGWIVGTALDETGDLHAILLTPEPMTAVLFAVSIVGLLARRK